jgi:hypothetical protein
VEIEGENDEAGPFAEAAPPQFQVGEGTSDGNEAPAGWWFSISVPQPNGSEQRHVWVLSIPDENEAREKLRLSEFPAEFESAPLSSADLAKLGVEPREVRRLQ